MRAQDRSVRVAGVAASLCLALSGVAAAQDGHDVAVEVSPSPSQAALGIAEVATCEMPELDRPAGGGSGHNSFLGADMGMGLGCQLPTKEITDPFTGKPVMVTFFKFRLRAI